MVRPPHLWDAGAVRSAEGCLDDRQGKERLWGLGQQDSQEGG